LSLAFLRSSSSVVTLSEQAVGDLEARFRDVPVPRLARTRVALWNPRWALVEDEEVADGDPLRLQIRAGEVIDARVVACRNWKMPRRPSGANVTAFALARHLGISADPQGEVTLRRRALVSPPTT
jgi:hypothetical protein